jgi:hypothetical protein
MRCVLLLNNGLFAFLLSPNYYLVPTLLTNHTYEEVNTPKPQLKTIVFIDSNHYQVVESTIVIWFSCLLLLQLSTVSHCPNMEETAVQMHEPSDLSENQNNSPPTAEPPISHNEPQAPPTPAQSPRHSIGSNNSSGEAALTNYQKYGSIRPPISVLQDEFLEMYRQWKEHADALKGLESIHSRENSEDAWTGHMNFIQSLYAKHHREDGALMGTLDSTRLNNEIRDVFQEAEECIGDENVEGEDSDDEEWQRMKHFADVLFSPGAKFIGAIQLPTSVSSRMGSASQSLINRDLKSYELVVMEKNGVDEIGNQKGILCRHKIRGDEQCIYMKVDVVPLTCVHVASTTHAQKDEAEEVQGEAEDGNSEEQEQKKSDDPDTKLESKEHTNNEAHPDSVTSDQSAAPKYTIQIEYSDGETICHGYWDNKTSRFNGTVRIVSDGRVEANPMGGTIISCLIGGRSGGNISEVDGEHIGRRRSSIKQTAQFHSFLLSPTTHIHPRGINPVPLHSLAEFLDIDVTPTNAKDIDQAALMDEIISLDNQKVVLHRARSAALRREALIKLVELGGFIDFSELARKRNIAQRRKKWRNAIGRLKPKFPRRLRRTRSTSSHTSDEPKVEKKKLQFFDHLAAISWTDLLEESGVQSEKVCANFRRRVALLNSLTFPSDEYKAQTMSNLRANGLSLLNSHTEWDQCISMGRTIALGWSWFERGSWGCFHRSAVVGRRCVHILFQMHSRLESNHDKLEKAYRKADGRLTSEQLDRITTANPNPDEAEHICGICHCDVNEVDENDIDQSEEPKFLICSHGFHWGCIREWLHDNTSCPVCRLDFNASF